mgnify:CR=1 FL=1
MVDIAQLVEHLIVVQKVARSSRVSHPGQTPRFRRVFVYLPVLSAVTTSVSLSAVEVI